MRFLSTPSVWRATAVIVRIRHRDRISIHALRVEGDAIKHPFKPSSELFLSTPSVWRATMGPGYFCVMEDDFYPRPPCGGRPTPFRPIPPCMEGFLSTPSVWRATFGRKTFCGFHRFLSTPSVWRATPGRYGRPAKQIISIHALRVEGDLPSFTPSGAQHIFLSTPSVWRATAWVNLRTSNIQFLSTPSVWRATF